MLLGMVTLHKRDVVLRLFYFNWTQRTGLMFHRTHWRKFWAKVVKRLVYNSNKNILENWKVLPLSTGQWKMSHATGAWRGVIYSERTIIQSCRSRSWGRDHIPCVVIFLSCSIACNVVELVAQSMGVTSLLKTNGCPLPLAHPLDPDFFCLDPHSRFSLGTEAQPLLPAPHPHLPTETSPTSHPPPLSPQTFQHHSCLMVNPSPVPHPHLLHWLALFFQWPLFSEAAPHTQVPEQSAADSPELTEVQVHVLYSCMSPAPSFGPRDRPKADVHSLIGDGDRRLQRCHVEERLDSKAGQPALTPSSTPQALQVLSKSLNLFKSSFPHL